jgi:protein-S-isoprenylcysteine O-methyltransferase Ste14
LISDGVLRIVLLGGLVLHKLVWEALKRGGPPRPPAGPVPAALRLVKLAKAGVLGLLLVQAAVVAPVVPILPDPAPLRPAGLALYLVGLATAVAGRLQLGRSWANLEDYAVLPDQRLVTHGLYGYIRHPIYAGDLLLLAGLELALNSWLVVGVLAIAAVVWRQAAAEERVLAGSFPGYEDYRRRTKRFIPFVV